MSSVRKLVLLAAIPVAAALLALAFELRPSAGDSRVDCPTASAGHVHPLLLSAITAAFAVVFLGGCLLALSLRQHRSSYRKLQRAARRVVEVQEEERARWSRELHDGTGQWLVAAKLLVEAAARDIPSRPDQARAHLDKAVLRLQEVSAEVRRISHMLRPLVLDTLGLAAALRHLVQAFDADSGLRCRFTVAGEPGQALPEDVATALYRVAQEALANVRKHANAQTVTLELAFEGQGVRMIIADDGHGFDVGSVVSSPASGIGLRNLRERLASVGGRLELASRPGRTVLTAAVQSNP